MNQHSAFPACRNAHARLTRFDLLSDSPIFVPLVVFLPARALNCRKNISGVGRRCTLRARGPPGFSNK